MANTLLTISMITREALMILENELTFSKYVNREYEDQFARSGAKIGNTLNIRRPVRYTTTNGPSLQVQNTTESYVPLVLDHQWQTAVSFTSYEQTLDIDDYSKRILAPQIAQMANTIDYTGMQLYKDVYNVVGTAGVTPTALTTYLSGKTYLDNSATPKGDRSAVLNPLAEAGLVGSLFNVFNPTKEISDQYTEGTMGRAVGFRWAMDQNVGVQTIGVYGGTPLVNGASQSGSTLITDGWTATTTSLNVGDVFTIAGVFNINPQNYQSTGVLKQFVVTAQQVTDSSGNSTISISPSITPIVLVGGVNTNAQANVTAAPADNAAITVYGATGTVTPQNMLFHRDAFTLATVDLEVPGGVDMAERVSSKQLGISIRAVRAYDINNDRLPCRLDCLGGWASIRPQMACRVLG